ncbi:transposase orfA IS5 family element [Sagittula stellata E-37]|uniref:Transposase orfA IS5 family element n=1 Tax=Sagittula stellata (strain ATCC 700073 / DSM 11524 / E-37) TaxID=388399 RepID=A3K735_SAGS3|nr:transposase orfA IS5 family element [Sagittula stellata E-37]
MAHAPREYGPHKTLYNRWKRRSDRGVFARIMAGLAAEHGEETTVMIDATHLKAHRTASSLGVKKGAWTPDWPNQGRHEHEAARHLRQPWPTRRPVPDSRSRQRLYRGACAGQRIAQREIASRRSRLRCRLVQRSLAGQEDTSLHPGREETEDARPVRQAQVQAAQPTLS